MASALPVVALVGRTNVGKSTLFNTIAEAKTAMISPIAGTTRDPNEYEVSWRDVSFRLIDTGGLEQRLTTDIEKEVQRTALEAASRATVICLIIDGKVGVTAEDRTIARRLRKRKKDVLVTVNKIDSPRHMHALDREIYELGFPDVMPLSAQTGMGVGDLLDAIRDRLPESARRSNVPTQPIRLALIGKTNTGKTTIMNALAGTDKYIATPLPHTTREPRDLDVRWHGQPYRFVDTAGLRKERKVSDALERAANLMTGTAIGQVDIALVVTDVTQHPTMHDFHVIDLALEAQRGIIMVANKWDLIPEKTPTSMNDVRDRYRTEFAQIPWAPVLFISATQRQRIIDLFPLAHRIRENQRRRLTDDQLERFLQKLVSRHPPQRQRGKKAPKVFSLVQESVDPQRFRLIVNEPRTIATAYVRYLERRLRMEFDFTGVPLTFRLTTRKA